jgi:ribosomal protein S18 acetylase RimI-like enzyme
MMKVFMESFPESERRPREWFDRLVEGEPRFYCLTCGNGDAMLCYWMLMMERDGVHMPFVYVEYLAVRKELRGCGVGTELMSEFLKRMNDVPVVLEVELPVCELAQKRVEFYERLGLKLMPDYYEQPSYGVVPGQELKLMLYAPYGLGGMSIGDIAQIIHHEVYGVLNCWE